MRGQSPRKHAGVGVGLAAVLLLAGSGATVGCAYHHHHHHGKVAVPKDAGGHGPPAHAPAHGHRRKHDHDGVELVFDSAIGVWVVVGHPDHYHDGHQYIRWSDGRWMVSLQLDDGWASIAWKDVPPRLAEKHGREHEKARKRGHHKHGHPAKRDNVWDD